MYADSGERFDGTDRAGGVRGVGKARASCDSTGAGEARGRWMGWVGAGGNICVVGCGAGRVAVGVGGGAGCGDAFGGGAGVGEMGGQEASGDIGIAGGADTVFGREFVEACEQAAVVFDSQRMRVL